MTPAVKDSLTTRFDPAWRLESYQFIQVIRSILNGGHGIDHAESIAQAYPLARDSAEDVLESAMDHVRELEPLSLDQRQAYLQDLMAKIAPMRGHGGRRPRF